MLPTPTDFTRSLHARSTNWRDSNKSSRNFSLAVKSDPQLLINRRSTATPQPGSQDLVSFPYAQQGFRIGDGKETWLKTEEDKKFFERSLLLDPSLDQLDEDELEELSLHTEEELQITELKALELEPRRLKLLNKLNLRNNEKAALQQRLRDVEQRKPNPELESVTASYREMYQSYVMAVRRNTDLTLTMDEIEKAKQKHRQPTQRHTPVAPTIHQFIENIQAKLSGRNAMEPDGDFSAGSSEELHQETNAEIRKARPPSRSLPISLPKAGLVPVYPQSSNYVYNRVPPLKLGQSGAEKEPAVDSDAVQRPSTQTVPQDDHYKSQLTFRLNRTKDPLGSRCRMIPIVSSRTSHREADYRDSPSDDDF